MLMKLARENTFAFDSLSCGNFDYTASDHASAIYNPRVSFGAGRIILTNKSLAVLIHFKDASTVWQHRMDIPLYVVDLIVASDGTRLSTPATIYFLLKSAPHMFEQPEICTPMDLPNLEALSISSSPAKSDAPNRPEERLRIPSVGKEHAEVVSTCFVYSVTLQTPKDMVKLKRFVETRPEMPGLANIWVPQHIPRSTISHEIRKLHEEVHDSICRNGGVPHSVGFQALRLAMNAKLAPHLVRSLLPLFEVTCTIFGSEKTAIALRSFYNHVPAPGPHTQHSELERSKLAAGFRINVENVRKDGSVYDIVRSNEHLALVYRVRVTPAGIYLEGPEAEVSNRVLRRYPNFHDHFIRVVFSDEDGGRLDYSLNTNLEAIYARFRSVLNEGIELAGKKYQFLGFSSSSLRNQSCWFIAPFVMDGRTITADQLIAELGDFRSIRSPAKCAARIGLAFTDTTGHVIVEAGATMIGPDIERNGRVFSDGCGCVSVAMVEKIRSRYPQFLMKMPPVAFQMRFQGMLVLYVSTRMKITMC
jgi:hypothetical protein